MLMLILAGGAAAFAAWEAPVLVREESPLARSRVGVPPLPELDVPVRHVSEKGDRATATATATATCFVVAAFVARELEQQLVLRGVR